MKEVSPASVQRCALKRKRFGRPRLLIVGCGDVGLRIVARVRDRFRIIALTTSNERCAVLRAAGAVPMVVNLDRRPTLQRLRGFRERVVHLAPPPGRGSTDPRTRALLAALRSRPQRMAYVSTTGVYGDRAGGLIDESSPAMPRNDRAIRRLDAEQQLRAVGASVLRAPGIYAHDRLPLERLRAGTPALAADDDVHTSHIHADDLARLCVVALLRGRSARVYNAVDDTQLKMGEYFDLVADRFDLPRPPRLPRAELQAAVSPTMYSFMSESRRLRNERIKRELRVRLRWPTVADILATAGN